jgi:hypothetical protein
MAKKAASFAVADRRGPWTMNAASSDPATPVISRSAGRIASTTPALLSSSGFDTCFGGWFRRECRQYQYDTDESDDYHYGEPDIQASVCTLSHPMIDELTRCQLRQPY